MNIADTVVVMSNGRIEDSGPPERVYLRPASLFTATFMGDTNIIPGRITDAKDQLLKVETLLGVISGHGAACLNENVSVSIRPEQIYLDKPVGGDSIKLGKFRMKSATFQGSYRLCNAVSEDHPDLRCTLQLPPQVDVATDSSAQLWARQSEIVVLNSES